MDHIESFKALMLLQMTLDEVMCRAFPTILEGAARVWFSKIPTRTIANFEQISKGFVRHFIEGGGKDIRSQPIIFSTFNRQKENH